MKTYIVLLTLLTAAALRAQEIYPAFIVHPYISNGDLAASRFWTPSTIALAALDGAAKTADSFFTRKNIDGGGVEYNPLARPFVHTPGVQIAAIAATLGAEVATAYLMHRRRHANLGRGILGCGAIINGLGAAASYKHRVAGW
jgi:hypothetical protein